MKRKNERKKERHKKQRKQRTSGRFFSPTTNFLVGKYGLRRAERWDDMPCRACPPRWARSKYVYYIMSSNPRKANHEQSNRIPLRVFAACPTLITVCQYEYCSTGGCTAVRTFYVPITDVLVLYLVYGVIPGPINNTWYILNPVCQYEYSIWMYSSSKNILPITDVLVLHWYTRHMVSYLMQ